MRITPLEIRQKTFEKAFRGVDKDEVQAFLLTLSQEWDRLLNEQRETKLQLEIAQRDVQKMREVESSLYKTLKTAEDTSTNIVEQANKSAELHLRETQFKCEQMLSQAQQQARSVVEDAYKQAEKAIAEMQTEVRALEQDYQTMERYLETMVRDLSNLATEALEKVAKSKSKPKPSTSAILSRAANVKLPKLKLDEIVVEAGKMPLTHPTKQEIKPEPAMPAEAIKPTVTDQSKPAAAPAPVIVSAPVASSPVSVPEPAIPAPVASAPDLFTNNAARPMRSQAAPGATRTVTPPREVMAERAPWPNPTPQSDPAPDHNTTPYRKTDPAPDVNPPKPEIEQPKTPTPQPGAPEKENPKPEIPVKEQPAGPEVEQPARDIPEMPGKPEIQPPLSKEQKPEPAMAEKGKSFFDMFS